jgi:hypothetical protein
MKEADSLGFPSNWSYIKAELAWLDRVLMRAMSKQRQTNKEIDRVARSEADRASSHWWKGFITLDPSNGGQQVKTEVSNPECIHPLGRYGDRIAHSQSQGIKVSTIDLCQQLKLGKFERDLLILLLAPEISRRYEKLFALLNNDESNCRQPTIDLALRLFCRSDAEWLVARSRFSPTSTLIKLKVIEVHPSITTVMTGLSSQLRLTDKAVNYLLSEELPVSTVLPKPRTRR